MGVRSVEALNATWGDIGFSSDVEVIERIRIVAQTQDENGGTDGGRGESLIVYA